MDERLVEGRPLDAVCGSSVPVLNVSGRDVPVRDCYPALGVESDRDRAAACVDGNDAAGGTVLYGAALCRSQSWIVAPRDNPVADGQRSPVGVRHRWAGEMPGCLH